MVANHLGRRRSIHARTWSRARRNGGTSSANSINPRGSIHSPKNGRMLKRLAATSNNPAGARTQREEGRRSQRTVVRNLSGRRSINLSTRCSCSRARSFGRRHRGIGALFTGSRRCMVAPLGSHRLHREGWPVVSGRPIRLKALRHRPVQAHRRGDTAIRHRKVARPYVGGLARGARINRCLEKLESEPDNSRC